MEYLYGALIVVVFLIIYTALLWLGRPSKLVHEPATDFYEWRNTNRRN